MRRLRRLRFGGRRQPGLPRPLRPPASGPGVGRHRLARGRRRSTSRGRWATSPTSSTRRGSSRLPGPDRDRARPVLDGGRLAPDQRPADRLRHGPRARSALAHNGNLVNAREIRASSRRKGALFTTTSDSEVILHLIARSQAPTLAGAIAEALLEVRGAYSLVILSREGIFAARDPNGIRPLSLGIREGSPVVASETCAFDLIGARYERDVEPGEIVQLSTRDGLRLAPLRLPASRRPASSSTSTSRGPTRWSSAAASPRRARASARRLAREHPAEADVVVPVPDSGHVRRARLRRGVAAFRSRSASSATTTSAGRSSSPSRRSATSASR